LKSILLAD